MLKTQKFIEPHKAIIEKAKKGNQHAMHHLYALYAKALLNTAFRILNNKEDAEDVLQDSFIKAFSRLSQFNSQSTFGAWIKRIVINRSIDALKKRNKQAFLLGPDVLVEEKSFVFGIEQNDLQSQLDLLYKALHQLPDGYRTVLSLYMLEGYDHDEISKILDIGVSTSISQLSRAKKKLKLLILNKQDHG